MASSFRTVVKLGQIRTSRQHITSPYVRSVCVGVALVVPIPNMTAVILNFTVEKLGPSHVMYLG